VWIRGDSRTVSIIRGMLLPWGDTDGGHLPVRVAGETAAADRRCALGGPMHKQIGALASSELVSIRMARAKEQNLTKNKSVRKKAA
jgi:hypothetical protein